MVREALRTLSERRLIQIIPGRGSIVRECDRVPTRSSTSSRSSITAASPRAT